MAMISKKDWELRERQWAVFHEWEASQVPDSHPAEEVIADIGTLLEWLPEDVRRSDADPGKTGIRCMHRILSLLAESR